MFFKDFVISALFAYVGSRASFWEPLGSLWAAFCLQSRPPGEPFGLQVGVLGDLSAFKLASLRAWVSEVASWVSFGPPSCPPRSDFDLQVGFLSQLLSSKLASGSGFGFQIYVVNMPFEFACGTITREEERREGHRRMIASWGGCGIGHI